MAEGLREALERMANEWAHMDCRVDLPENQQWGEGVAQGYSNAASSLLRALAAHPADEMRDPIAGLDYMSDSSPLLGTRPQPTLETELKSLREYCGQQVDDPNASEDEQVAYDDIAIRIAGILRSSPAVRPLPTREQIAEAIFGAWLVHTELRTVAAPVQHCEAFADAVLALFTGGEE